MMDSKMQQIEKQYNKFETELEKNLGSYINNYNMKLEEIKNNKKAVTCSLIELKEQFIVLTEQTIQPTIEKFNIFLQNKNQDWSMELKTPLNIEDKLPSVVFEIRPPYSRNFGLDNHPQLSFQLTESQKIAVHAEKHIQTSRGTYASEGEFNIDKITSEFVEQKILDLINGCYDKNGARHNE